MTTEANTSQDLTNGMPHAPAALEARTGIYLPPAALEPHESNQKARPLETAEARSARVKMIAKSIAATGQHYPVLVVEVASDEEFDGDGNPKMKYEYVDGGARVDAIKELGAEHEVWCSIVPQTEDLFRTAVTSNLHRTQNSIMEMAYIIQEVRERNGWKGRGGQVKVCEYLGMPQNRVSDYERLLRAPKAIREMIDSGEIGTVDAALKLLAQKEEDLPAVTTRAREIARKEAPIETVTSVQLHAIGSALTAAEVEKVFDEPVMSDTPSEAIPDPMDAPTVAELKTQHNLPAAAPTPLPAIPAAQPKVTAKHVAQAAAEVTGAAGVALSRAQIVQSFMELTGLSYPAPAKAFIEYFVDVHVKGKGSEKKFQKLFDAAVGFDVDAPILVEKKPAKAEERAQQMKKLKELLPSVPNPRSKAKSPVKTKAVAKAAAPAPAKAKPAKKAPAAVKKVVTKAVKGKKK